MKRWFVVEIEGDEEERLEPDFDLFPGSVEVYGDWRVVAEWSDYPITETLVEKMNR